MTAASIVLAPCPHCGGKTVADQDRFYGGVPRWQVSCDQSPAAGSSLPGCGYRGPFAIDLADAVRAHNKIGQNCGACNSLVSTAEKCDGPLDSPIPNPVSHTAKPSQVNTL